MILRAVLFYINDTTSIWMEASPANGFFPNLASENPFATPTWKTQVLLLLHNPCHSWECSGLIRAKLSPDSTPPVPASYSLFGPGSHWIFPVIADDSMEICGPLYQHNSRVRTLLFKPWKKHRVSPCVEPMLRSGVAISPPLISRGLLSNLSSSRGGS